MTKVQIAVWLWWETSLHAVVKAASAVVSDDIGADKVNAKKEVISIVWAIDVGGGIFAHDRSYI